MNKRQAFCMYIFSYMIDHAHGGNEKLIASNFERNSIWISLFTDLWIKSVSPDIPTVTLLPVKGLKADSECLLATPHNESRRHRSTGRQRKHGSTCIMAYPIDNSVVTDDLCDDWNRRE